jgi:hypothetical protein
LVLKAVHHPAMCLVRRAGAFVQSAALTVVVTNTPFEHAPPLIMSHGAVGPAPVALPVAKHVFAQCSNELRAQNPSQESDVVDLVNR